MKAVAWWQKSPSPYTLIVWSIWAILKAKQMKPKTFRKWCYWFATYAFSVGLVVLPFDSVWVILQNVKFGYLFPNEVVPTLATSLSRNVAVFALCLNMTKEIRYKIDVKLTSYLFLASFIPLFAVWFGLAVDPSITDWTYAIRFGYSTSRIIVAFVISHIIMKAVQAMIFFKMWS